MKLLKNKTHIYGFEDYNIVSFWDSLFNPVLSHYYSPYGFCDNPGVYLIVENLPSKPKREIINYWEEVYFDPSLCYDHKELLKEGIKVYVHPSCKLSRSMAAEKYKKCLNPWVADVVVIPEPNYSELRLADTALFINEDAKIIVSVTLNEKFNTWGVVLEEGVKIRDITTAILEIEAMAVIHIDKDLLDAEFFHRGNVLYIPNSHSYVLDLLTRSTPTSKIVYEESLQESLGSESNKLDFDSLTSIKDMLDSSDSNTVAAGLKALSMMDWIHYPNSVKFILNLVNSNYKYNSAADSTSVKYMLKTISGSTNRRRWPGNYDKTIYKEDYELFRQLKIYYDKVSDDELLTYLRYVEFMKIDADNVLCPRLREAC